MEKITKSFKSMSMLALAMTLVIAGVKGNTINVSAGASDIVVDDASFSKELDTAKWNSPNDDVITEDEKIVFPAESTGDTRLITRQPAEVSAQNKELFSAEFTLKLKSVPAGEKFMIATSLATVESYYGEPGNLEITFESKDGIEVSVLAYDESGNVLTVVKTQDCGVSLGSSFSVKVHANTNKKMQIVVNNRTIYDDVSPIELEGRIGFLQTGSCEAEISSAKIISHQYETPENPDVKEDFEKGSININALTSKMSSSCLYYPAGVQVEEYNGSQVLMFRNASMAYFGTLYQYSNFELTFDVPYMLHTNIAREDGTLIAPAHLKFMLTIGDEAEDYDSIGYEAAAEGILFGSTDIQSFKGNFAPVYFEGKDYYNVKENEGYSVKVTMIDTILTVGIKPLDGKSYTEIASYKVGNTTPLGYIHIWSTGQANFALDNFYIKNLDKDAKTIEVEYQGKVIEGTEDWVYEPTQAEYLEVPESKEAFDWNVVILLGVIVGAVIVGGCYISTKIRRCPKKKEDQANE